MWGFRGIIWHWNYGETAEDGAKVRINFLSRPKSLYSNYKQMADSRRICQQLALICIQTFDDVCNLNKVIWDERENWCEPLLHLQPFRCNFDMVRRHYPRSTDWSLQLCSEFAAGKRRQLERQSSDLPIEITIVAVAGMFSRFTVNHDSKLLIALSIVQLSRWLSGVPRSFPAFIAIIEMVENCWFKHGPNSTP